MPGKDKNILQRLAHGAAAVTINSDFMEVILFGGYNKNFSVIADTVVLKFGKYLE